MGQNHEMCQTDPRVVYVVSGNKMKPERFQKVVDDDRSISADTLT